MTQQIVYHVQASEQRMVTLHGGLSLVHNMTPTLSGASNFKETASTTAASFDVDADVDAGIGFISIVDVGVNIVIQISRRLQHVER